MLLSALEMSLTMLKEKIAHDSIMEDTKRR